MKSVLVLGATSDVGMACAELFAQEGFNLLLASRNAERLASFKQDQVVRNKVSVEILEFDALDTGSHPEFVNQLPVMPTVVLCMFGYLGDQLQAQNDDAKALKIVQTNYVGAVSILEIFARSFEKEKKGTLIGVSSVAGERGRMSNYLYGSSKAGFTAYLSGLRNRLFHSGVHVITVKPGFMYTKMTEGLDLPPLLTATPETAGKAIFGAYNAKKNTVYVKGIWRLVMWIIRNVPEFVFKRLKL